MPYNWPFTWNMQSYNDLIARLDNLHANQLSIIRKLNSLLTTEQKMAIDLTGITAEVERNTSVIGSVKQLVANLVEQINNIPPSTDPQTQAALDALKTTLSTNDDEIANLVQTNTQPPAGPGPAAARHG